VFSIGDLEVRLRPEIHVASGARSGHRSETQTYAIAEGVDLELQNQESHLLYIHPQHYLRHRERKYIKCHCHSI
jgi:hypothetical protein